MSFLLFVNLVNLYFILEQRKKEKKEEEEAKKENRGEREWKDLKP